jgi:hypothetical protein
MTIFCHFVWQYQCVEFAIDRLIERLHRILVVLEDEAKAQGVELPPLAVYDVRGTRWLLTAGISLDTLRACESRDSETAEYLLITGSTTTKVHSRDPSDLLTAFASCARSTAKSPIRP